MSIEKAKQALKQYFGYDHFRPMQEEIISEVLAGKDVVVLMPTGGGKSVCFQIPALVKDGVAIVVSPLIALMKDQVEGLRANGIKAAFINSSISGSANMQVERLALNGDLDLLYVSPEKLISGDFMRVMQTMNISLIAVDEAHCISQWGHDFRPEYTKMNILKEHFPDVPVIALTATADKLTRKDIVNNLSLKKPRVFISSFDRPNLSLNVLPGRNRYKIIKEWIDKRPGESGIIYCLSRKSTEDMAGKLKSEGIKAACYHAGMGAEMRAKVQEQFIRDDVPIICATIAFGMGIDKSNVRWIIHYNLPKNIESYYQEIGRAGRDGLPSDTLLFYSYGDVAMLQQFIAESGQREILQTKLERIEAYANSRVCRRKVLLSYFGQHLEENCGNCDVCKDPPETLDGTVLAQKALSASIRLKESVGANLLIGVLRGSGRQEIISKGYDKIKTYGAGSEVPRTDWQQFVMQMMHQGLFEIAYDEGNALKVTELGKEALYGKRPVELVRIAPRSKEKPEKARRDRTPREKKQPMDEVLFQRLRVLRKRLADEQGVPPYLVFGDASLKEMSSEMPTNEVRMRKISGVGDQKLRVYGPVFINEILQFIQEKHKEGAKIKGASELITLEMYKKGTAVEAIAAERELNPTTIYSHLAKMYRQGDPAVNIFDFITDEELKDTLAAAAAVGEEAGLRAIFEAMNEEVPYHKIKFALAYREMQNA